MIKHIIQRICSTILLLLAVSFFTFWLMHATPGNFFDSMRLNPQISQETVTRYENLYHLNDPFLVQYASWLANIFRGEWGYSFYYNVSVTHVLGSRLFNTFVLSFTSLVLTWGVAIPLGIWAALRRNQWVDRLLSLFSFVALATPGFYLAVLLLYAASRWGALPLGGMHSPNYDDMTLVGKIWDTMLHLVIPATVLSLSSIASLQRIMRGNMLGVLRQQYILAARAKGLSETVVIYRHALRNAFNPLVTLLGYEFAALLSGAALIEIVCSWPGLGSLLLTAVRSKDVYLVMSSTLLAGVLLIIGNCLADILLTLVDPRIRYEKEIKNNSRIQLAFASFRRNRVGMLCLWVLVILYAMAIFADFVCPYAYQDEDRDFSYCPPTAVEFFDHGRLVHPFVYHRTLTFDTMHRRVFVADLTQKYPLHFFKAGRLFGVDAPGRFYLWGADARGRDLFSRIWYGARISLSIGVIGVLISFILGLLIGGIAGYYGGWVDGILMRICEMFMMIPGFYLMLALRAAVPENFNSVQVYASVVVILALIGWASLARIIRGMALSLRERDFVLAAKTLGVPDIVIIFKHILPQTISFSMATLMLTISSYILAEAGLSVVGLGIQDPIPSWGNLLSDAMGIVPVIFAPWILLPGLFIFIAVLCFNVVGDSLRDAFDPMFRDEGIEL